MLGLRLEATIPETSDTGPPAVSLGILCYNQAEGIGAVIESALAQTRAPEEVVVVDDGSCDGSLDAIGRFPGVRVVVHPSNMGRAAARTTLLRAACGDIVVYLDGDTAAAPDLVEELLLEYADPRVGAVGGIVHERLVLTIWDRWRQRHGTRHPGLGRDSDASLLFGWGLSCRREVALAIGGFRPGAEDIDLSLRLRDHGHRLVLTPRAQVYHMRSDSFRTVQSMLFRWGSGCYVAFARNGDTRIHPHVTRVVRRLAERLRDDLVVEPDWALALASLALAPWEMAGIIDGVRYVGSGETRTLVRGV